MLHFFRCYQIFLIKQYILWYEMRNHAMHIRIVIYTHNILSATHEYTETSRSQAI